MFGLGKPKLSAAQAAALFVNVSVEQASVTYPRWRQTLGSIVSNLHANPSETYRILDNSPHSRQIYTLAIVAISILPVQEVLSTGLAQAVCSHVHHEISSRQLEIGPWVSSFVFDPISIVDGDNVDSIAVILSDMIDIMGIRISLHGDGESAAGMRNHLFMINMVNHFTSLPVTEFWPKTAKSHRLIKD